MLKVNRLNRVELDLLQPKKVRKQYPNSMKFTSDKSGCHQGFPTETSGLLTKSTPDATHDIPGTTQ